MRARSVIVVVCVVLAWQLAAGKQDAAGPRVPAVPPEAWGAPSGGLRVAAWTADKVSPRGHAYVVVAVQNVSEERMLFDRWYSDDRMWQGEDAVPITRLARRRRGLDLTAPGGFESYQPTFLEPGEVLVHVHDLGLTWDLSVGGDYTWELAYEWRDRETKELLYEAKAPPVRLTSAGFSFEELLLTVRYAPYEHRVQAVGRGARDAVEVLEYLAEEYPHVHARVEAQKELERIRDAVEAALEQGPQEEEPARRAAPEGAPAPRIPPD